MDNPKLTGTHKVELSYDILIGDEDVELTIYDSHRGAVIEMHIPHTHFMKALSRLVGQQCEATIRNIGRIGQKMEMQPLIFEIEDRWGKNKTQEAIAKAKEKCPDGWEPDLYFGSQDSFFLKGGKHYAKTIIRRWVNGAGV